jgi:two-component system sensor histidine kinase DegS
MEGPAGSDPPVARPESDDDRLDALYAEAKGALGYAANQLRGLTDQYRETHRVELRRWHRDRTTLERMDRQVAPDDGRPVAVAGAEDDRAAAAETAAATDVRQDLRRSVDIAGADLGEHQRDLARLDLVTGGLESAWRFLERDDPMPPAGDRMPADAAEMRMRVLEAREQERVRLAQEIHDGPAQMIANAFFQVDYVERLMERDPRLARTELRYLREVMRRELADIRTFIAQLRPPALEEAGLDGAIREAVATLTASVEVSAETVLEGRAERLTDMQQVVVLRVLQEALHNTREHAGARTVSIATSEADGTWVLEVRDDGRGFDVDAIGSRGRQNFGLQFMRERAELVGGTVIVRSRPGAGTVVRLTIEAEGKPG